MVASVVGTSARADEEDNFHSVLEGPGELYVRGPNLFKKYINKPDATAQAFDEMGWFRCEMSPIHDVVTGVQTSNNYTIPLDPKLYAA